MAQPVVYSLPISGIAPSNCPPVEDAVPKVKSVLDTIFQTLLQYKAIFVRYCGVTSMPVAMWEQLAGSPSTLVAGNLTRFYTIASEAIPYGAMVNLFLNAGQLEARKASATVAGKECDGYCSTPSGAPVGEVSEFILRRGLVTLTGPLTVGQRYWLSATVPGGIQTTKPVAAGNVEQYLGMAITTTSFYLDSNSWIQH